MSPKPSGFTTNPICLHRPLPLPWVITRYLLSKASYVPWKELPETLRISPPRALTTASSFWGHKVQLRGPGPSSLEKQEALAGSSRVWGVLGAKYAEARAPWESQKRLSAQEFLLSPPQPDLIIFCLITWPLRMVPPWLSRTSTL